MINTMSNLMLKAKTVHDLLNRPRLRSTVVIMRGGPGAGKSTFLTGIQPPIEICSADIERTVDGKYTYDRGKNYQAHGGCMKKFVQALITHSPESGVVLAVDNVARSLTSIAPYIALAQAYSWDFWVITIMPRNIEAAVRRNTHGVPRTKALDMHEDVINTGIPLTCPHLIIEGDI
jgi:hypothetical protein